MKRFAYDFERPLVELETKLEELKRLESAGKEDIAVQISYLEKQIQKLRERTYSNLTAWQKVQIARHPDRPRTSDYIEAIFTDFIELHGDRVFRDDVSIIGGFARLENVKVMVVGHRKGRNTKESIARNFGMPHPEGYRKAVRLMRIANKFKLPLITFIDTPGAYPGIGAEERGQAIAIAQSLMEISVLEVPVIVANIGEGGSGGALAIGFGDRIIMLENSYYSVITPEGCVSILWDGEGSVEEATEVLGLTSDKLLEMGIVDCVVREPLGGAHYAPSLAARELKKELVKALEDLSKVSTKDLVEQRYSRLRHIGYYTKARESETLSGKFQNI
ncbi:MAG: acetyl-CoA carboxylase carboxyltransferase subunit alpha [Actinobacteria bacterium]|nr:acetyl-CoA carboxylase carboxyltransferase subunit alpha [Actinomycetota bacterium]